MAASRNYDQMSRAEKFEDEKRRIIESCFAKREDDGTVSESYITHIRIEEDAAYPSSPPPPDSPPNNKKPRVIIVAVRKAGRVRMHKARENSNGTFSIGKTWMLDHLSAIESFTGSNRSPEDAQKKQWAGDTGMTVTIQKPYFWKAVTSKEKDFFIGSLIKIHRKYAGRDPELSGFTEQEMVVFGAGGQAGQRPPPRGPAEPASQPNMKHLESAQRGPASPGPSGRIRRPGPAPVASEAPKSSAYGAAGPPAPPAPQDERMPPGHRRYQDTTSTASNMTAASNFTTSSRGSEAPRGDQPRPAPADYDPFKAQDPRSRVRNDSPATSTKSGDSFGGSTLADDRRGQSAQSFETGSSRTEVPPPRISGERARMNGTPPISRNGPSGPPGPAPGPRSPDRRPPAGFGQPPPGAGSNGAPNSGPDSLPPRQRPFMKDLNESGRGPPNEPPARSAQRERFDSDASSIPGHVRDASGSDASRPSTSGRTGSPSRPPALNLSTNTNTRDGLLRPAATPAPSETPSSQSETAARPQTEEKRLSREKKDPAPPPPLETTSMSDMASKLSILSPTDSASPNTPASADEPSYRPGLGPMIKSGKKPQSPKDIRAKLLGAAKAHQAGQALSGFTPRAKKGQVPEPVNTGSDGVTGVFKPAPKSPVTQLAPEPPANIAEQLEPSVPEPNTPGLAPPPQTSPEPMQQLREATPPVVIPEPVEVKEEPPKAAPAAPLEPVKDRGPSADEIRKKQLSQNAAKYARALGVNPVLLEGRTADIEGIFEDIGWKEGRQAKRTYDDLLGEIKRELTKVETGSWLDAFEGTDDRVVAVSTMLDKAIAECEELDGLLTLYNVELSTLNDDVQFIEAQSQGLQVQTANQRQLQVELNNLLRTISISSSKLAIVRAPSLGNTDGLTLAEDALSELYKALRTIAPTQIGNTSITGTDARAGDTIAGDIGGMKAVEDRKKGYELVASEFTTSLGKFLNDKFQDAEKQIQHALGRSRNSLPADVKLDAAAWDAGREILWMYSPVLIFARDVVIDHWENLVYQYAHSVKSTYRKELRQSITAWNLVARRPTGSEQDALFTTQEQEEAGMARKLTVKRSKTTRATPRVAPGERKQEGKIPAYQAFYNSLLEICKVIFVEQNFIVRFFHASAVDVADFGEMIVSTRPEDRGSENLLAPGMPEPPNSRYGSIVKRNMELLFESFAADVQGMIDQIIAQDPLYVIGLMWAVEINADKTAHTNQDFLSSTLNAAQAELSRRYDRFIDEQVTAIDATKVKISKRKGVIPFMKTFPLFATIVEDMLPSPAADDSEVRRTTNHAYERIHRAMFMALTVVGNKDQEAHASGGADEEKEALNQHILLIENYNHYIEEVDVRNNPVLISGREEAERTMSQHMEDYIDSVVRRPLGQLLNTVESAEAAINAAGNAAPSSIATLASHRANTFKKNVSGFDAKEIRKGVELLRKRVEKHFGDADDERISSKLVEKVWNECEQKYLDILERLQRIVRDVYEGQVDIELRKDDITNAFHQR